MINVEVYISQLSPPLLFLSCQMWDFIYRSTLESPVMPAQHGTCTVHGRPCPLPCVNVRHHGHHRQKKNARVCIAHGRRHTCFRTRLAVEVLTRSHPTPISRRKQRRSQRPHGCACVSTLQIRITHAMPPSHISRHSSRRISTRQLDQRRCVHAGPQGWYYSIVGPGRTRIANT